MTYPAYASFGREIGVGFARWKVYMALQPPYLDFADAKVVKIEGLAKDLRMGKRHVRAALDWLEARGYIIASKDAHGVRSLRIAYALKAAA